MQVIDTTEMQNILRQNGDIEVINVLDRETFENGHIPGTDNVPLEANDFVKQVEGLTGGKEKPVVVYCASEDCSASPEAAKKLEKAGFAKVYDYSGGTKAWHEAGLDVEIQNGKRPTNT